MEFICAYQYTKLQLRLNIVPSKWSRTANESWEKKKIRITEKDMRRRVWCFLCLMAEQLWLYINKWRCNNQWYLSKYPLRKRQHATNLAFIQMGNLISHSSVFFVPWHMFVPAPSGLALSRNTAQAHYFPHILATPTSPIFYHYLTKMFYKEKNYSWKKVWTFAYW